MKIKKNKNITIIAAIGENNELGLDNKLIWNIKEDLKRFKKLTTGHSIIMGRKTFESISKALPGRLNIVLTKNKNFKFKNVSTASNIHEAIELTKDDEQPFIIGGSEIYSLFINMAQTIELTRVHNSFKADTFFPDINFGKWNKIYEEKFNFDNLPYSFITYKKNK
ncbi:MAG: dihydrofolate reductase [Flavobacteriaceae bacterium]